jgi:hypothetical protein
VRVYIVLDAGEHYIKGVFDSEDKAETFVIQLNTEDEYDGDPYDNYYIEGAEVK